MHHSLCIFHVVIDDTVPHVQRHDHCEVRHPNTCVQKIVKTSHPIYRFAFFLFSIEALSLICLSRKLCFFFDTTALELLVSSCSVFPNQSSQSSTHWTAIMIGLFLFFCAFVDELVVILFFFPFRLPYFSRPSRPLAILAIRSS